MKWFCTPLLFLFLLTSTALAAIQNDIDGDGRIGPAETIHALKTASESPDGSDLLVEAVYALQVTAGVAVQRFDETPLLALMVSKGTDALDMAWVPGGDGSTPQEEIVYNIHLSTNEDFIPGPATFVKTVTGESQTEVTGLSSNTLYYGRVVAVFGTTISEASNRLQAKTYEFEVLQNGSTIVAIAGDLGLGPHTTADGVTYVYTSDQTPPVVGSILYSEDVNGDMTQRRVDSVSSSSGTVTVITSDASLKDVIDRGSIYSSFKLFDVASEAPLLQAPSNTLAIASTFTAPDGSQMSRMEWKDRLLIAEQTTFSHNKEGLKVTPKGQTSVIQLSDASSASSEFKATVSATFHPELITTAEWGGLIPTNLDSAKVAARGTLTLTALAEYSFTAAGTVTDDFRIGHYRWISIYSVGTVPVYQEITLSLDVQASASAEAEITAIAEAQLSETVEVGATYDGVKWTPYIANSESESFTASLDIMGKASAEIRLIPKIEVKFYRVIGGSLTVEPFAESNLALEETTSNFDFLTAHPERFVHLTSFDASLGLEANVEVRLTVLGNTWDILPSTCVLGTGECAYSFDPLTLFSIPTLAPDIPATSRTGDTYLGIAVTDGVYNQFDPASIAWEVYADDSADEATVTPGSCNTDTAVVPHVTTCEATLSTDDEGGYTIFVSGHGILGTVARHFEEKKIIIDGTPTPDGTCASQGLPGPDTVSWEGKTWQRCAENGYFTWEEAKSYCGNLTLDGGGWHLPNKDDLKSLVVCSNGKPTPLDDWDTSKDLDQNMQDATCCYYSACDSYTRPTIDGQFSCSTLNGYWSSSGYDGANAWYVMFIVGEAGTKRTDMRYHARCVR